METELPAHLKGKKASDTFLEYIEPFFGDAIIR